VRARARNASLVAGLRAVADPTRLAMLQLLVAAAAPVCVCDITSRFRLGQPTISHHLRILKKAGLVTVSRRGVWAYYAIRRSGFDVLRKGLDGLAQESRSGGN
jgi:DNA-binding transcriptional ArsR family regulator